MCGNVFYDMASCKMIIHDEKLFNYVKTLKECKKNMRAAFLGSSEI